MRALVYTDLQATEGHERLYSDPTKSLQIWRVEKFFDCLAEIYTQYSCDCLWDLGDTTDDRSAVPVPAINAICANLARFPSNENNLKLIGNHEQYLRNTRVNIGQMFAPYFRVIEGCERIAVDEGRTTILACSYPASEDELMKWIRQQQSSFPTILLGHFQLTGCWTRAGQFMTGVKTDNLQFVKLGLLGHIHKPQSLGKLHYVGSPFQQNWGEAGEQKRVGIVDTIARSVEWVPLEGFPEYLEVSLEEFIQNVDKATEHRWRVILQSSQEAATFFAHPCAQRAEPIYNFDVSACSSESSVEVNNDAWAPAQIIGRYLERNLPGSKGIDMTKDEMSEIGMTIMSS